MHLRSLLAATLAVPSLLVLSACETTKEDPKPTPKAPEKPENYTVQLPGGQVKFDMIGIQGGTFTMGSPDSEAGRKKAEGPQREVAVNSFWMGKCEVTWDEYDLWSSTKKEVDGVTRPTPAYTDMTFGMGEERWGYPAICMTQLAAKTYCEWLSKVTGHKYRLPTEAEWEYACRAGSSTPYSFADPTKIDEYAWHEGNSDEEYHRVGVKKPNAWGLHDMHGNVSEWVQDQYAPYTPGKQANPMVEPKTEYPRVVRGGSWSDATPVLRSASRIGSEESWKEQDPQIPKSIWYHTDAVFVGFRVVREK